LRNRSLIPLLPKDKRRLWGAKAKTHCAERDEILHSFFGYLVHNRHAKLRFPPPFGLDLSRSVSKLNAMGTWNVDTKRKPGILWLELDGLITPEEMQAFVAAHNAAVDSYGGRDYKVFCDVRKLAALAPECAELFEKAKAYSSGHKNFRGSGVWASNALIAMQHKRTSTSGGVVSTELISEDEKSLWDHLAKVYRNS